MYYSNLHSLWLYLKEQFLLNIFCISGYFFLVWKANNMIGVKTGDRAGG